MSVPYNCVIYKDWIIYTTDGEFSLVRMTWRAKPWSEHINGKTLDIERNVLIHAEQTRIICNTPRVNEVCVIRTDQFWLWTDTVCVWWAGKYKWMVCVLLSGQWISVRVLCVVTWAPRGELTLTRLKVSVGTLIAVVLLCWAAVIFSACVQASVADDFQGAAWNNIATLTSVSLGGLSVCTVRMCVSVCRELHMELERFGWQQWTPLPPDHCLFTSSSVLSMMPVRNPHAHLYLFFFPFCRRSHHT